MRAKPLSPCGTIGICSPSHIAVREKYEVRIRNMKEMGFRVKEADNLYKTTYGYLSTPEERASDFNQLIKDPEVELVFFGGGEGSNELLPFIDFNAIKENPKRILSYSDATTILDAIWANTGLEVYYGQMPEVFFTRSSYDMKQFKEHIITGVASEHEPAAKWKTLREGTAEGILIGGYLRNFAMQLQTKWFPYDRRQAYVLFLEDNEKFGDEAYVSAMLTHIQQSGFMENVTGILFGHYSVNEKPYLYQRLKRLAEEYNIPSAYCDDFGHGENHAILEIGRSCELDTIKNTLKYL